MALLLAKLARVVAVGLFRPLRDSPTGAVEGGTGIDDTVLCDVHQHGGLSSVDNGSEQIGDVAPVSRTRRRF